MKFHFLKKEEQPTLVMFLMAKGTVNCLRTESDLTCLFFFFKENKLYQQIKAFHRSEESLICIYSKQPSHPYFLCLGEQGPQLMKEFHCKTFKSNRTPHRTVLQFRCAFPLSPHHALH